MKFNVAGTLGQPVKSAKLRLYVNNASTKGGVFYPVTNTAWAERTVTWANAPAAGSTALATVGAAGAGTWIEVNVSAHIKAEGTYAFRVKGGSSDGVNYNSKDATANRPQLIVTY